MDNQEEKDRNWNQLLLMLAKDSEWFKKPDTEHYKQITRLGRKVYSQQENNKVEKIDEEKYKTLINQGLSLRQIAAEFQISNNTLLKWRKANGYVKNKKSEELS